MPAMRITWSDLFLPLLAATLVVAACDSSSTDGDDDGDGDGSQIDAAPLPQVCGSGDIEAPEQCDDGNADLDIVCAEMCRSTCGNGPVDDTVGELCDTAVTSGTGSCPSACDDGDPCTTEVLSGSDCTATCIATVITDLVDGDMCCPTGGNANNDSDCTAACGNGALEDGELCDTMIVAGEGACPTMCNDGMACTTDAVTGSMCQQACGTTPITMPVNGDGCCPPGETIGTDNDCVAGCGDGVVTAPEKCDTMIPAGMAGACPTVCNDMMACTTDVLTGGNTCAATCTSTPITMPINGDGCCPAGANANNDNNCMPKCGNNVVEMGEQCDAAMVPTATCSAMCQLLAPQPTAFRFTDMDLRDPHTFVDFLGCRDVTDTQLVGFAVNNEIQTGIQTDDDMDGILGLSIVAVFRPLGQALATSPLELYFPDCTAPMAGTTCTKSTSTSTTLSTATNLAAGTCLGALPMTLKPYTPALTAASGPCYSSDKETLTITLSGIPIVLTDAQVGATYTGNPATGQVNGVVRGFISEADANATILPADLPLVGGKPLSLLLPGGDPAGADKNCATYSDKDTNNGVVGWWFYLNFTATKVNWNDM